MEEKKIGIIFDMDGVLLDSMQVWDKAGIWYLERKGKVPEKNLSEIIFAMTMKEGADYLIKHYQLDESNEDVIEGINQTIEHFYQFDAQLKPGVLEFLKKANKLQIPMAIATSTDKKLALAALKRLQILPFFKQVFSCSEFKEGKTSPEIYLMAMQTIGTEVSNTWVVEDSLYASKTAKKAGFLVMGIYDEFSKKNEEALRSLCDGYLYELLWDEKLWRIID